VGDSAHAMVPLRTQGAAQAILDAVVLGDALAGATSAETYHLADGPESQTRKRPHAGVRGQGRVQSSRDRVDARRP
jgi:2-polyprenyl-6-methoxyphenol hydroxylase-like FAD-dependent oxidoreductase